ncbi:hypothetical protein Lal_00011178 [Lupinus albus]|nr:hypothetical protein Lal_00011178 [Lupinus albus]
MAWEANRKKREDHLISHIKVALKVLKLIYSYLNRARRLNIEFWKRQRHNPNNQIVKIEGVEHRSFNQRMGFGVKRSANGMWEEMIKGNKVNLMTLVVGHKCPPQS